MPRRKKSSPAEDFIDLVSLLPWYVGLALALVSFVLLHSAATPPSFAVAKPGDLTGVVVGSVWPMLARIFQYLVPALCVIGAAVSAWRRHTRRKLVDNVTRSEAADSLDGMTWRDFEKLVGEGFRLQGYGVLENDGPGPDGGVDLVLRKGGEKYLVQCKQWRAFKVSVPVVRELYGVMAASGAAGGFVVTSGRFTAEAQEFAMGRNIRLIDGPRLQQMLRQAKVSRQPAAAPAATPQVRPSPAASTYAPIPAVETQAPAMHAPACPKCRQPMLRRTAKKGANAGKDFWGCSEYPRCRGTA
ncbi:restriction endonuclease [Variovorax sp. dw_308]|uniref:restriction endonuclease n=1 Tax=Variovorax sp. dw_308 TaxID=2721546 RepID=UPI001C48B504|nr:restriction endonuclease [Variovorax sp. dw_308]